MRILISQFRHIFDTKFETHNHTQYDKQKKTIIYCCDCTSCTSSGMRAAQFFIQTKYQQTEALQKGSLSTYGKSRSEMWPWGTSKPQSWRTRKRPCSWGKVFWKGWEASRLTMTTANWLLNTNSNGRRAYYSIPDWISYSLRFRSGYLL